MATSKQNPIRLILVVLTLLAALAAITWRAYGFAQDNPGGNDFIPRYVGVRLFLTEGQSPYSPSTTQGIQEVIYGRPAHSGEDQQLFVYPFYTVFFITPFALIGNYNLARALWMAVSLAAVMSTVFLSIKTLRWQPQPTLLGVLLLFVLTWYHTVRPLINGNLSVLTALFLSASLYLLSRDKERWAGVLLACATIKPQAIVLVVVFTLLWRAAQKRWQLWLGFCGAMLALLAASTALDPGWLPQYVQQVLSYSGYTQPGTPAALLSLWLGADLGMWLGGAISLAAVGGLIYLWWQGLRQPLPAYYRTVMLTLALTPFTGIYTASSNYLTMIPALVWLMQRWQAKYGKRAVYIAAAHSLLIGFSLWWLFLRTISNQGVQHPLMVFVFPAYLLITLSLNKPPGAARDQTG